MLYLDLGINNEDFLTEKEKNSTSFIRKIKIFIRKHIIRIFEYEISGRTILVLSKLNKTLYKKLKREFDLDVTKTVCISDELLLNEEFKSFLLEQNIKILDGKWLFKYLCVDIIKYISFNKNEKIEEQEISILVNKNDMFVIGMIKEISEYVHNINIITKDIRLFQKIKAELYEEKGMILNVSNNYRKSANRSNIILNFNFSKKELEKVNVQRKSVIINFENNIKLDKKSFDGIFCNFCYISFSYGRYLEFQKRLNHFNKTILYESFIYKQTYYKNILNDFIKDNVKIEFLEGIRGNIKLNEFEKIN